MDTVIAIVQNIMLPKLEKDLSFSVEKVDVAFWEKFTTNLLHFEVDAKPLYVHIYSLELANAEKIIDKLPNVYAQFLKELAESYVLGEVTSAADYLLKSKNSTFAKEIDFLKTMQQAIKSVERKHIKADLPTSYERLTFELSENDLSNVTKKKGREDLKEKMKLWDRELEEEVANAQMFKSTIENRNSKRSKVISLSWIKYAAAACVIIAAGIFYFKKTNTVAIPAENKIVIEEKVKDKVEPQLPTTTNEMIVLTPIETITRKVSVLRPESLGYTSEKKTQVIVHFNDATKRIKSLEKLLAENKAANRLDSEILTNHIKEMNSLKSQQNTYSFDGNSLTLYEVKTATDYEVLQTEEQDYYLKKGADYFHLKKSNGFQPLKKVLDVSIIEILEKISFENE
ncbi:hypothetical protein [Flavobacterium faecale]|uniref:hypothetical protein n=1 Tax=Flavobacterium faecale TaxID=1355330 RepID=UPI003AAA7487